MSPHRCYQISSVLFIISKAPTVHLNALAEPTDSTRSGLSTVSGPSIPDSVPTLRLLNQHTRVIWPAVNTLCAQIKQRKQVSTNHLADKLFWEESSLWAALLLNKRLLSLCSPAFSSPRLTALTILSWDASCDFFFITAGQWKEPGVLLLPQTILNKHFLSKWQPPRTWQFTFAKVELKFFNASLFSAWDLKAPVSWDFF